MKYLKYLIIIPLLISVAIPAKPVFDRTNGEYSRTDVVYLLKSKVSKTPLKTVPMPGKADKIRNRISFSNPIMVEAITGLPN